MFVYKALILRYAYQESAHLLIVNSAFPECECLVLRLYNPNIKKLDNGIKLKLMY